MTNQPVIRIDFTVGFGNNLFQFVYAKLLAEKIGAKIYILPPFTDYFGLTALDLLVSDETYENVTPYFSDEIFKNTLPLKHVNTEEQAKRVLENPENCNYLLNGYFEDYTLYENDLEKIRSWFIAPPLKDKDNAVIHLRLGDRLFIPSTYQEEALLTFERYKNGLDQMDFKKLYIVSDLPHWRKFNDSELLGFRYHTKLSENTLEMSAKAASYVNELVDKFSSNYEVVFSKNVIDIDFYKIMTYDKILFGYSTFAWWAATLSNASQVGVFGPWRPWKKEANKNLGNTNYPGWFKWQ